MISNKCYYGFRALLELAVRGGRRPVTISDIAAARNVPVRFLEAILRELKQAGIVDSARGKDGGYTLAKPAKLIRVNEILRVFEGPLLAVNPHLGQPEGETDVLTEIWTRGATALNDALGPITLAHLAERERDLQATAASDFTI